MLVNIGAMEGSNEKANEVSVRCLAATSVQGKHPERSSECRFLQYTTACVWSDKQGIPPVWQAALAMNAL
jgi:hypothetical protein